MLENLGDNDKVDLAFQIIVSLRDAVSLAKKATVTYEQAIRLLHDVNPALYTEVITAVGVKNINDIAKYYMEQAQLESITTGNDVQAVGLINTEIARLNNILDNEAVRAGISPNDIKYSKQRIFQLIGARDSLNEERRITEHRIFALDYSYTDRADQGASHIGSTTSYTDYKLNNDTYLRIRLLHPDRAEAITGADMIYEQHDEERRLIRFVFLQYKMWEAGRLSISSSSREMTQIRRMQSVLCANGFCQPPEENSEYRFPHCCAFLRPTDRLQQRNNKLISSGIHIPVCNTLSILEKENGVIDKRYIRHSTLTQELFEHLFNKAFIGSRWLAESVVAEFYLRSNIIQANDSVVIYAREIKVFERRETSE